VPSVLWHCWLGGRKGIRPVKNWVVRCWHVICLEWAADLHMALWCHCHSLPLAAVKSRLFFYRAMLCIRGTRYGPVSVCPSVTSWSSTKTAKHRITQTTPHNSPGTLVYWGQRSPRNSTWVTPYGGAKCRWGGWCRWAVSQKRYKIDARFLLKSNRKSHAIYRMVILPMTLSAPWPPQTTPFSAFCTARHSFVTGEPGGFKFGTLTYHSKSHPSDEKSSLKGAWSGSADPF